MSKRTIGSLEIHTFPLPPKDFNPLSAPQEELAHHGFPRRPDLVEMPDAAAKWVSALRRYPRLEHITPEFTLMKDRPGPNVNIQPNVPIQKGTEGHVDSTSDVWSGSVLYVSKEDRFIWIGGAWTVPHAYQSPSSPGTQYSSVWLGIDGVRESRDVMQAGTETDSDGTCYAWFEWFPANTIQINNFPVSPGDVVHLLLCATKPTTASVFIINLTSMTYTSFSSSAPPGTFLVGNSAEAIMERSTVGGVTSQLPRYGEVFFDDVIAGTVNGLTYPIGLGTPVLMLADDLKTVISTPIFEGDTDALKVSYTGP
ncbi:G1 family glutamic endopeptidase [Streptomyces sp. NPDC021354]|uniref:G1 family glutamic endopeptidase n=1 Tax=Streptomyces sp. NPDC021354 TaxID=3154793 RepID=UPI0033E64E1F